MESHECIFQCVIIFAFNIFIVQVSRYRVVDIKECYSIFTYNGSDEFAECSVNIYFAGYRNTLCCQTAVDIAWYKSELCLECRPAFSGDCNVFAVSSVFFYPVFECQLILSKF